jgi:phosphoribosylamine--glycine ligase
MLPYAQCLPFTARQFSALATFAEHNHIDFTVVGPEDPLVGGIADVFRERGLRVFGPGATGAALEGSKIFAKELMTAAGIPTAQYRVFTDAHAALAYLEQHGVPVVVKADGTAAGKGAIVALDMETARNAVRQIMTERIFGSAGDAIVIEDYLQGDEISSTAICNGIHYLPLTLTQDHKRAFDGDQGLNTGGMGVFTPLPFVDKPTQMFIYRNIVAATLRALKAHNIPFYGVLYSNIMLTAQGPMVLEHNTRFGDPETQALMLLLREDVMNVLDFAETMPVKLDTLWHLGSAVSLSLASGGYPGSYHTGIPITGVAEANKVEGVQVFHAGTALRDDGQLVTAGGRVLSVAAHGATLREAVNTAYEAAARIHFEGMHYRRDIARRRLG